MTQEELDRYERGMLLINRMKRLTQANYELQNLIDQGYYAPDNGYANFFNNNKGIFSVELLRELEQLMVADLEKQINTLQKQFEEL